MVVHCSSYSLLIVSVMMHFAGALKLYLRELPQPLMTFELYEEWMHLLEMYVPISTLSTCILLFVSIIKQRKCFFNFFY